jgi:hypothetical protein
MPIVNFLSTLQLLPVWVACSGKNGIYLVRFANSSAMQLPALVMAKGLPNLLFSLWVTSRQSDVDQDLSDKLRSSPPATGRLITYRYQGFTDSGLPRFPVYIRQRFIQ